MWTNDCESAFQEPKHRLMSAPVLTIPDGTDGFVLYTDVSRRGLGCAIMQHERLIRKLKYEKTIQYYDLKLVAVLSDLKIWRHYLYRRRFDAFTNHQSLKYFFLKMI